MSSDLRLIYATYPESTRARAMGRAAVEAGLAACAHVLAGGSSCYRWEGRIEESEEAVLLLKTTLSRSEALLEYLRTRHPYQVPALLVLPVENALSTYVDWVRKETSL